MKKLFFTLFVLSLSFTVFGQTSLEEIDLKSGYYTVGFQHYTTHDSSRTYHRESDWSNQSMPRPIPVSIWYPAEATNTSTLTVLDYLEILKEEEEWEHLPNDKILDWFYYLGNTEENQKHLTEISTAHANAKPIDKQFPVVVYAPSYLAASIENFALCEYLASHGFVVISSPSRGTDTRKLEGGNLKDLETQARDIEFLMIEIAKFPFADMENMATMGFSYGGISNVLTQMRNESIKAIVSLDGSIKYQYYTIEKSAYFNMDRVNVPFVHLTQKDIPEQVLQEDNMDSRLNTDFEFFDSLKYSDAYQFKFNHLTHGHFSTLGILFRQHDPRQDKSDKEIMASYNLASQYTLQFLNAYLNENKKALVFINNQPSENGIEKELISMKTKKAMTKPFSFQDFNELAAKQNYDDLQELYADILKSHSEYKPKEPRLNNLGLHLMFNPDNSKNAVKVFEFATYLYPESANLFDSLAEGYLYIGKEKEAVENFKKSLELYPQNQNAIVRLKQLTD